MRKLTSVALVVAALTFIPCLASAENFYVSVRGGPGITSDTENGPASAAVRDREEYKVGLTGSGAVGYMFPFGLRGEGEVGFVYSPLKREGGVDIDGSVKSYLLMANAYYDLKLAALGPFKPYVGFGLGVARVNIDQQIFRESVNHNVHVVTPRTSFAYQARVGVGYEVNRWLDVSMGYRFVHIDGSTYDRFGVDVGNVGALNNHSLELGAAFKF